MRIRIALVTLVSLALITASSFGQATGRIAIRFWDAGCKKAVVGVTVTGTGPQKIKKVRSNSAGELIVEKLMPGTYELTALKYGFKRLIIPNIEIRPNETLKDVFNLEYGFASEDETPTLPAYDPCKQIDKPLKTNPLHVGQS